MARKAPINGEFREAARLTFTQGELDDMVEAALESESENLLRLALATGGNPDGAAGTLLTPLVNAAEDGKTGMMKLLLDHDAHIDLPGRPSGVTALIQSVVFHRYEGITLLLARKANPDKQDGRGRTPVLVAAELLDGLAIEMLLKAGANPATPDNTGMTPLGIVKKKAASGLLTQSGEKEAKRIIALLEAALAPKQSPKTSAPAP